MKQLGQLLLLMMFMIDFTAALCAAPSQTCCWLFFKKSCAQQLDNKEQQTTNTLNRAIERSNWAQILSIIAQYKSGKKKLNLNRYHEGTGQLPLVKAIQWQAPALVLRVLLENGACHTAKDARGYSFEKVVEAGRIQTQEAQLGCHVSLKKWQALLERAASDLRSCTLPPGLKAISNKGDDEPPLCPSCFEEVPAHLSRKMRCDHRFHLECAQEWIIQGHNTCPLCRRPFATTSLERKIIKYSKKIWAEEQNRDWLLESEYQQWQQLNIVLSKRAQSVLPQFSFHYLPSSNPDFEEESDS